MCCCCVRLKLALSAINEKKKNIYIRDLQTEREVFEQQLSISVEHNIMCCDDHAAIFSSKVRFNVAFIQFNPEQLTLSRRNVR